MHHKENVTKMIVNEEEIREFISSHAGEIRGLYYDRYSKMGGWNGLIAALNEVEEKYEVQILAGEIKSCEDHLLDRTNVDTFEQIIREEI